MPETPGVIVIARVRCAPGKQDEMRAVLAASQERSRAEDGCLRYGFSAAIEDPDAFVAVEEWADRAALEVHLRTDHIREFIGSLPGLVAEPPDIAMHEVAATGPLPLPS